VTREEEEAVPEGQVALALAELRSALEVGLARIDGQLALLVQRSDQTDKALEELEERVSALEKTRWPLPTVAVLASITAVALTIVGLAR
jgi:chromosome segregation ATPase